MDTGSTPLALVDVARGAPHLTALSFTQHGRASTALPAEDVLAVLGALASLQSLRVLALDFAGLAAAHVRTLAPLVEARDLPHRLASLFLP